MKNENSFFSKTESIFHKSLSAFFGKMYEK